MTWHWQWHWQGNCLRLWELDCKFRADRGQNYSYALGCDLPHICPVIGVMMEINCIDRGRAFFDRAVIISYHLTQRRVLVWVHFRFYLTQQGRFGMSQSEKKVHSNCFETATSMSFPLCWEHPNRFMPVQSESICSNLFKLAIFQLSFATNCCGRPAPCVCPGESWAGYAPLKGQFSVAQAIWASFVHELPAILWCAQQIWRDFSSADLKSIVHMQTALLSFQIVSTFVSQQNFLNHDILWHLSENVLYFPVLLEHLRTEMFFGSSSIVLSHCHAM